MKYGVDRSSDRDCPAGASMMPVVKGGMMVLNQLSNLETTVGRFYINLPNRMIDLARFSLPYTDPMGDGERLQSPILPVYQIPGKPIRNGSDSRLHHDRKPAVLLRQPAAGRGRRGRQPGLHFGGCHVLSGLSGVVHVPHRQQRSVKEREGEREKERERERRPAGCQWQNVNSAALKWCIPGCRKGVNSCRDWISERRKVLQPAVGSGYSCYSCTTKYGTPTSFFFLNTSAVEAKENKQASKKKKKNAPSSKLVHSGRLVDRNLNGQRGGLAKNSRKKNKETTSSNSQQTPQPPAGALCICPGGSSVPDKPKQDFHKFAGWFVEALPR